MAPYPTFPVVKDVAYPGTSGNVEPGTVTAAYLHQPPSPPPKLGIHETLFLGPQGNAKATAAAVNKVREATIKSLRRRSRKAAFAFVIAVAGGTIASELLTGAWPLLGPGAATTVLALNIDEW